jgi:hypothetical protein
VQAWGNDGNTKHPEGLSRRARKPPKIVKTTEKRQNEERIQENTQ